MKEVFRFWAKKSQEVKELIRQAEIAKDPLLQAKIMKEYLDIQRKIKADPSFYEEVESRPSLPIEIGDWVFDGKTLDYIGEPYGKEHPYFIYKNDLIKRPFKYTWFDHLCGKYWFTDKQQDDFNEIFRLATFDWDQKEKDLISKAIELFNPLLMVHDGGKSNSEG